MNSNNNVEKIKERLSIVDVISSYIQVEQSGKNFKARCPFHNEKTPSFFISSDRGTYYCFGCGEKGDIFSFVEKFEGTDFVGALKLLAEKAGVALEARPRDPNDKEQKELYYEILEEGTKFFELGLHNEPKARAYLLSRGVTDASIKSFRIGYVKDEWRSLSDYLTSKGYKIADIEAVGLVKRSEKAKSTSGGSPDPQSESRGFYDRFRSRIIFPISDSSGRVIAFSGRIFNKDDATEAKYLNSPDTILFNKSNVLFGIDKAKTAIRMRGYSIIVEGQMDLVLSHQAGFTNTVAVSGTAFTDDILNNEDKINNLGLIRRLSPNIKFAYDGDKAGIRAAGRSAMIALSLDMQVKIAELPEGKDPADIINEDPKKWEDIIKNSTDIINFHINQICKNTNDIRTRGQKIREIIFPFLVLIKSSIDRSSYVSLIHSKTNIPPNSIIEDFENYERNYKISNIEKRVTDTEKNKEVIPRRVNLEKRFFGIIFWQEKTDIGIDKDKILSSLKERVGEEEFQKMFEFQSQFSDVLALDIERLYGNNTKDISRDTEEILLNLEEEILNEKLFLLRDRINQIVGQEENFDPGPILKDLQRIGERLEEIKKYRSK